MWNILQNKLKAWSICNHKLESECSTPGNTGLATNLWVVLVALAERIHPSTRPPSQAVHPSVHHPSALPPSAHPSPTAYTSTHSPLHPPFHQPILIHSPPPTSHPPIHLHFHPLSIHPRLHQPTLIHPPSHPPTLLILRVHLSNKTLQRATLCQALGQVLEIQQQSKWPLPPETSCSFRQRCLLTYF